MSALRCGIIGLGVGEQHIAGFLRSSVDVVALCDFDPVKLSSVGSRIPGCRVTTSAQEIIDADDIDIVSIASYDDHHAGQVLRAISRGKHVFVEKPVCLKENELTDIYRLLDDNPSIKISTNTILRSSARFSDVKDRISHGELGLLYSVEADYNYGRIHKLTNGWRGKIPDYSVMLGGGIHMVDLLIWLVGSPVIEVSAVGNKFCSGEDGFGAPDMVTSIMRFSNGTIGKVSANFGCVYPHFHKVTLYGTHATFENHLGGGALITSRSPSDSQTMLRSEYPGCSKGDLIPSFVSEILGSGKARVGKKEVFETMSTCMAIERSLKSGKTERVNLFS